MVSPEFSHYHQNLRSSYPATTASKSGARTKTSSFISGGSLFVGGAISALILMWVLSSITSPPNPNPNFDTSGRDSGPTPTTAGTPWESNVSAEEDCAAAMSRATFYDDPKLSYSIGKPIKGWDEKRREWMNVHHHHHSSVASGNDGEEKVLLLTGSQPSPCRNPIGDHLLLRFFKNKVDYSRIHGHAIFYNNALIHPKMASFWAKIPLVRAAMVSHPESEWIFWVDSDAAITDMDFKLPLSRYSHHNLVLHGWFDMVYNQKSWTSLNAGVFLIRNCQWSMDFLEVWAEMGPQSPDYSYWGKVQRSTFKDKLFPESDDQAALIYLILKHKERWADKIYLEGEYYLQGYWVDIVGTLGNTSERYREMERRVRRLRRRRAEVEGGGCYSALRDEYLKEGGIGYGKGSWRRPFITHFTGCQPCSGNHNQIYSRRSCWDGMRRALDFADDQVLRSYGFVHSSRADSGSVSPLPFDYPA